MFNNLGRDNQTWEAAQTELKEHFRLRKDYAELINECRNIKVVTLKELFDKVKSVNYELNELYNFEDKNSSPIIYTPENNDRYLVGIVKEKLINLVHGNVGKNQLLIQMFNKCVELRLLDDERTVDIAHRKRNNFRQNKYRQNDNNHSETVEYLANNRVNLRNNTDNNSFSRRSTNNKQERNQENNDVRNTNYPPNSASIRNQDNNK